MVDMLFAGLGKNEDVVQIDENIFVNHVSEEVVDQGLENCWGIGEVEWHHQIFIKSGGRVKSSLPFIPLSDADKVVGITEVELGEDHGEEGTGSL